MKSFSKGPSRLDFCVDGDELHPVDRMFARSHPVRWGLDVADGAACKCSGN